MKRILALISISAALAVSACAQWDEYYTPKNYDSLFKRIGGVHKLASVIETFAVNMSNNQIVMANPQCAIAFSKGYRPYFTFSLTQYLADMWGGPQKYMGPDMVAWHRMAKITDEEWALGEKCFRAALDKAMVPMNEQKEIGEFMNSFRMKVKSPGMSDVTLPMGSEGSLYRRLGGGGAIAAVVDEFVNRLSMDPVVTGNKNVIKSLTSGKVSGAGIKYLVTEQLIMASGGPSTYSGRSMAESHKGLMVTEAEWAASAQILKSVLDDFKVPEKEQGELFNVISGAKNDSVGK
jgi:hemoglobin